MIDTRCPARTPVTPGPTSTTSAENSCPSTCGSWAPLSGCGEAGIDDRAHRVLVQVGAADAAPERTDEHLPRRPGPPGRRPPRRGRRARRGRRLPSSHTFQTSGSKRILPSSLPRRPAGRAARRWPRAGGRRRAAPSASVGGGEQLERRREVLAADVREGGPDGRSPASPASGRRSPAAAAGSPTCRTVPPGRASAMAVSSWPGAPLASMTTSAPGAPTAAMTFAAAVRAGLHAPVRAEPGRALEPAGRGSRRRSGRRRPGSRSAGEHERADRPGADQHHPVAVAARRPGGPRAGRRPAAAPDPRRRATARRGRRRA